MTTHTQAEAKSTSTPIPAIPSAHADLLPQREQEEPDRSLLPSEDRLRSPSSPTPPPINPSTGHSFGTIEIGPTTSPVLQRAAIANHTLQRQENAEKEENQEEDPLQAKAIAPLSTTLLQRQETVEKGDKDEGGLIQAKALPGKGLTNFGQIYGQKVTAPSIESASSRPMLQRKLTIGQPNDQYEQEADRVADQVMRMPAPNFYQEVGGAAHPPTIQRLRSTCQDEVQRQPKENEEQPEETVLQAKSFASPITPIMQRQPKLTGEEQDEKTAPIQTKALLVPLIQPLRILADKRVQRQSMVDKAEEVLQTTPLTNQINPLVQLQAQPSEDITAQAQALSPPPTHPSSSIESREKLQRQILKGEEEESPLQTKQISHAVPNANTISRPQNHLEGHTATQSDAIFQSSGELTTGGTALPKSLQSFYETRFGYDLSGVRIHTGTDAEERSEAIQAHAFTYNNHIWLGKNQRLEPSFLLAHELAHVIQQNQPKRLTNLTKHDHRTLDISQKTASAPPTVQRLAYWVPEGLTGGQSHDEVLNKIQGDVRKEAPVPHAQRSRGLSMEIGFGLQGRADLYKPKPTTVGVFFQNPIVDIFNNTELRKPAKLKGGSTTPRPLGPQVDGGKITRIDEGPSSIKLGEIKPASKDLLAFGEEQLKAYEKGFGMAHTQANLWAGYYHRKSGESGAPPQWNLNQIERVTDNDVKLPPEYKFEPSAPKKDRNLVLADFVDGGEGVKTVFNPGKELGRAAAVKGGLYGGHYKKGVWAWFAKPANLEAALTLPGSAKYKQNLTAYASFAERLQNEIIDELTSAPHQVASLPKQAISSVTPSINRKAETTKVHVKPKHLHSVHLTPIAASSSHIQRTDKKPKKLKDDFKLDQWKRSHNNLRTQFDQKQSTNAFKQLHFLELAYDAEEELDHFKLAGRSKLPDKNRLTVSIKTGGKHNKPKQTEKSLVGLYSWMRLWTRPPIQILGTLRSKFGTTFVKVSKVITDLRAKLHSKLGKAHDSAKKGGTSYAAIAVRAFWRAAVQIGTKIFRETISLLGESLAEGLKKKISTLIPLDVPTLQQGVADNFPILQEAETRLTELEAQAQEKIDAILATFDVDMKKLQEYAETARKYGDYIKWAMVAIQCGTPPGWGCLKLLLRRLVAEMVERILKWCPVQKKFAGLVAATGWFDQIPFTLAKGVADNVESVLPATLIPVFDQEIFKNTSKFDPSSMACSEQEPSAEHEAMAELKEQVEEELGTETLKALTEAMDKYGVVPSKKPTVEEIQQLRDKLLKSEITADVLRQYIKTTSRVPKDKAKTVDIAEFVEHVKTTVSERRLQEIQSKLETGVLDKKFESLRPGEIRILGLSDDDYKTGRVRAKQIIRKGNQGEPERSSGIVDMSFDPSEVNCETGALTYKYDRVILKDVQGNPVQAGLEGTTMTGHFFGTQWKKILCSVNP